MAFIGRCGLRCKKSFEQYPFVYLKGKREKLTIDSCIGMRGNDGVIIASEIKPAGKELLSCCEICRLERTSVKRILQVQRDAWLRTKEQAGNLLE